MQNGKDESMSKVMPLVMKLMNAGGWNIVEDALNSQDPARPLGMFLGQLIIKVATALQEKGMQVDMTVFMRPNGVLTTILDLIEKHFSMPPEFSDEIFNEVKTVIEGIVQESQAQGQAPQGQPQQQGLEQGPPQQGMQ
jgi:hypothetical protein